MKLNNMKPAFVLPLAFRRNAGDCQQMVGKSRLSVSMALLSSVFALLIGGKANAQIADYVGTGGTSTAVTYYSNETGSVLTKTGFGTNSSCGSGGLSGMTVSNTITSYAPGNPHVYVTVTANAGYALNISGFSAICRSSGTGATKARLAYSTDGGSTWTAESADHAQSTSGSCGASTNNFSWTGGISLSGVSTIMVAIYPYSPSATTGTFQVNQFHINGAVVATTCAGTPTGGSAVATPATICGSGVSSIALSGASSGGGISYQWQSSPDNTTWSNIAGETNNTYATPTLSTTTYYRNVITCATSSLSSNSSSASVTVNSIPTVAPITGSTSILIGTPSTLASATTGGVWSSSTTSVASIGTAGIASGVNPGTATISYTVTSAGCSATATAAATVLEPNTLAVYTGAGGNGLGTSVMVNSADATVGSLTATGFGVNSPCGSGGLSGITVSTVYATYSAAGPHIYYSITPNSGFQLNITGMRGISRSSGTGPQLARLAYSLDNGTTWIDDATDHIQGTSGSCGANSNNYTWTSGLTLMGVTTNVLVAVYPYNPSASTGTFQLNRLSVYGNVTPAGSCTGATGGTAEVSGSSLICGSGSKTINLTGASSGSGISYQWQSSPDNTTWSDITGETNTSYATGTVSTTTYYRNVVTCSYTSTNDPSASATVSVNPIPSAGAIFGVPSFIEIGTPATLSNAVTGGVWSSDHAGIATVGSATGDVAGVIPGTANILYTVTAGGCFNTTSEVVNIILPGSIAVYLGNSGTNVSTVALASVAVTTLTATGFGTATPCGSGGLSGLTNNGVTTFATTNASIYFQVTPNPSNMMDVTGFHVTLRKSPSGLNKVRMAYSLDNGATWNDDGVDQTPDAGSCSNSTTDFSYSASLPLGVNSVGAGVIFAIYPYDPIAVGGTIQVNSFDIVGSVAPCEATISDIQGETTVCTGATTSLTEDTEGGTWESGDPGVATIDATGLVTGVMAGTSEIFYTVTDANGCTGQTSVVVTVIDCEGKAAKTTGIATVSSANIGMYPNPATSSLHIAAAEKVNVSILSVDGKVLIDQKDAKEINVSNLVTGVYMVKIYNQNNVLIKTARFTKN